MFCSAGTFSPQGLHRLCLYPPELVVTYRVSPFSACVLRSISLSIPGVPSLDDCLLPEGPARLPGRQAAHVLQSRCGPDAVAPLHHWGQDGGLCPLCLRLPALLWDFHRQPLVRLQQNFVSVNSIKELIKVLISHETTKHFTTIKVWPVHSHTSRWQC